MWADMWCAQPRDGRAGVAILILRQTPSTLEGPLGLWGDYGHGDVRWYDGDPTRAASLCDDRIQSCAYSHPVAPQNENLPSDELLKVSGDSL